MNQEKTQCNTVVVPAMDAVSVDAEAGHVVIRQHNSLDGSEEEIWIHPVFAEAVCAAIMRAAKEARSE